MIALLIVPIAGSMESGIRNLGLRRKLTNWLGYHMPDIRRWRDSRCGFKPITLSNEDAYSQLPSGRRW